MKVTYTPDESDPQTWDYNPTRLMSAEREAAEKLYGETFSAWTVDVLKGGALARRILLFILLKRDHPPLKFIDVDFAWDQFRVEMTRGEYEIVLANGVDDEVSRNAITVEMITAPEDSGKVYPLVAG